MGEVEVNLHVFLVSALYKLIGQIKAPACYAPYTRLSASVGKDERVPRMLGL
jgi:hypothetical protein